MALLLLACDDDDIVQRLVVAFGSHGRHELRLARTLSEARDALSASPADLVLLAPPLPGGDPLELAADHPGVVLLTDAVDEAGASRARDAGVADVLPRDGAVLAALPYLAEAMVRERRHALRLRDVEDRLKHADRLAGVGRIAATVAHEIGTPLGVVRMRAQLLGLEEASPEIREATRGMIEQIDRVSLLIRRMLDFARAEPGRRRAVELREVVGRSMSLLSPAVRRSGVEILVEGDVPVWVQGDEVQLQQVLFNLVNNALAAMPDGGRLSVSVESGAGEARIEVVDTGTGIAPELLGEVFRPFFTTRPAGEGTGLGLSVVQMIVADHGGSVEVASEPGGTRFTVRLPAILPRT